MSFEQLPLRVVPRLPYSAENFVEHAGVRDFMQAFKVALARDNFQVLSLLGTERSGKTHALVKCAELAGMGGRFSSFL